MPGTAPPPPQSLEEMRDRVIQAGGVLTFNMHEVRDAYGAHRLGAQIVENISEKLRGLGIGHVGEAPGVDWTRCPVLPHQ